MIDDSVVKNSLDELFFPALGKSSAQDMSISHDFLGQDSQETHAFSSRNCRSEFYTKSCVISNVKLETN